MFYDDQYTLLISSRSVFLRMRNVSDQSCRDIKTQILRSFFFSRKSYLCEITWKSVESGGPQMTTWRMRIARWITNATDTHSEYVVFMAFPCNSGCTNAPLCYVIRTLPLLLIFREDKNILLVQPAAWSLY